MQDLTFGEQVKIILSRKDMTIKELAKKIEGRTGKKMSRQNLTQRLGRDNFQERDMRMIAEILGCPFYLNILDDSIPAEKTEDEADTIQRTENVPAAGRRIRPQMGRQQISRQQMNRRCLGRRRIPAPAMCRMSRKETQPIRMNPAVWRTREISRSANW